VIGQHAIFTVVSHHTMTKGRVATMASTPPKPDAIFYAFSVLSGNKCVTSAAGPVALHPFQVTIFVHRACKTQLRGKKRSAAPRWTRGRCCAAESSIRQAVELAAGGRGPCCLCSVTLPSPMHKNLPRRERFGRVAYTHTAVAVVPWPGLLYYSIIAIFASGSGAARRHSPRRRERRGGRTPALQSAAAGQQ
jgi:hypothetical protein